MTELIIKYAEPTAEMDRAVIPSEVVGTLVRCKDCIHYDGWCGVHLQPRLETDFCNYGDDTIPLNYVEVTEEARAKMKGGNE